MAYLYAKPCYIRLSGIHKLWNVDTVYVGLLDGIRLIISLITLKETKYEIKPLKSLIESSIKPFRSLDWYFRDALLNLDYNLSFVWGFNGSN